MKSLLSVSVSILALAAFSFGQITIHSTDFPGIGASGSYGRMSTPATFDIGSPGENQTWTFGQYLWTEVEAVEVVDPATTPFGASFPTATHAFCWRSSETYALYNYDILSTSERLRLGNGQSADGSDEVRVYVNPALELPFPCTYQTAWTKVHTSAYEMEGMHIVEMDSSECTVDGWGTVTTPYGARPALRVFVHTWIIVTVDGEVVDAWSAYFYEWKNQQGYDVCRVQSLTDTSPIFSTGWLTMFGVPLSAEPMRDPITKQFELGQNYPNPFNPSTTLPVALEHPGRVSVDVYDATGRLVSHTEHELPAGTTQLGVDGSHWTTGVYFARVSAAGQTQTTKMHLMK